MGNTLSARSGSLYKRLIINYLQFVCAPKSVFLRRLGSNMFRIIGHAGCYRVDFAKLAAPKFFRVLRQPCHQPLLSLYSTGNVNYTRITDAYFGR